VAVTGDGAAGCAMTSLRLAAAAPVGVERGLPDRVCERVAACSGVATALLSPLRSESAPTLDEVAAAVRLIAERTRVIPEGAGALALAAALRNDVGRKVVCVVSGGNIDLSVLARILNGETP